VYRWRNLPAGRILPRLDDLPELPDEWVEALTGGELDSGSGFDWDDPAVIEILSGGEPCTTVRRNLASYGKQVEELGHHKAMISVVMSLVKRGQEGHEGVNAALELLAEEFDQDVERFTAKEFEDSVRSAIVKARASPYEGKRGCCNLAVFELNDPEDEFWNERPTLATIRQYAKARLMPPWGVLAGVLGHVVAATPPEICLPPIIGGKASLNLFIACVGASGDGKGGSMAVARSAVHIAPNLRQRRFCLALVRVSSASTRSRRRSTRSGLRYRSVIEL
jgi:hypothetical protein